MKCFCGYSISFEFQWLLAHTTDRQNCNTILSGFVFIDGGPGAFGEWPGHTRRVVNVPALKFASRGRVAGGAFPFCVALRTSSRAVSCGAFLQSSSSDAEVDETFARALSLRDVEPREISDQLRDGIASLELGLNESVPVGQPRYRLTPKTVYSDSYRTGAGGDSAGVRVGEDRARSLCGLTRAIETVFGKKIVFVDTGDLRQSFRQLLRLYEKRPSTYPWFHRRVLADATANVRFGLRNARGGRRGSRSSTHHTGLCAAIDSATDRDQEYGGLRWETFGGA